MIGQSRKGLASFHVRGVILVSFSLEKRPKKQCGVFGFGVFRIELWHFNSNYAILDNIQRMLYHQRKMREVKAMIENPNKDANIQEVSDKELENVVGGYSVGDVVVYKE